MSISKLILYILEGKVRHEFGDGCKKVLENEAGDFIYIKPGVPHEVFNMSDTEPVVAFVARSSAEEWDNIIPYDRNQPSLATESSPTRWLRLAPFRSDLRRCQARCYKWCRRFATRCCG